MDVRYSDWGLANNFGSYIEINRNLKYYPELRRYVVKHELKHKKGFDLHQEFIGLNIPYVSKLMWFCLKYPKTLIDLLPIQIRKKTLIYDTNLLFLYSILLILIVLVLTKLI